MNSYILTFQSTHDAMKEEENLRAKAYVVKMIPTPRGISSECGFSIRIESSDLAVTENLTTGNETIERIYLIFLKERSKHYEEIYRRKNTPMPSTGN